VADVTHRGPERVEGGEFTYRFIYDGDNIARGMLRVEARVLPCYVRERRRDPSLEAEIQVSFTIAADGQVRKVHVENTLPKDSGLPTCVEKAVAQTRFPRPGLPLEVSYPMRFTLDEGAGEAGGSAR